MSKSIYKTFSSYKSYILTDERSKKLIFQPDGRNYYVYRITNIKINQYYYGSRVTKLEPIDDPGIKYFSSSTIKNFINEQKIQPNHFKYKIIKIFNNPADSIIYESFLHQWFKVSSNYIFINKANQTPFGWNTSGNIEVGNKIRMILTTINPKTNTSPIQDCHVNRIKSMSNINPVTNKSFLSDSALKGAKSKLKINPKTGNSYKLDAATKQSITINKINPNTKLSIIQNTALKLSGVNSGHFKGYYIINNIKYITSKEASENLNISFSSICKWCKYPQKIVTNSTYTKCKYLQSLGNRNLIVGKSFNQLGFDFQYL